MGRDGGRIMIGRRSRQGGLGLCSPGTAQDWGSW